MGRDVSGTLNRLSARPMNPGEKAIVDACERVRAELLGRHELVGDAWEAVGKPSHEEISKVTLAVSSSPTKGLLLYRLVRLLRPRSIVEFGTGVGTSANYLCYGLRDNGFGVLHTVEASASRSAVAVAALQEHIGRLDPHVGVFDDKLDLLDGADLFFLDGNHYGEPTHRYVTEAIERMASRAVLLLDDVVGYTPDMDAAWQALRSDPRFVRAASLTGLGEHANGLGVLVRGTDRLTVPLLRAELTSAVARLRR